MAIAEEAQSDQLNLLEILLVEDDDGDALLVSEHLRDADLLARVHRAVTLREAREVLTARSVDCILLDLGLPDAAGLDALEALIEQRAEAAIIVLTGLDDPVTGTVAVSAGADDYLLKSAVDDRLLSTSIRYALERRKASVTALQLLETELRRDENLRLERALLPRPSLRDPALRFDTLYRPGGGGAVLGGDFVDAVEQPDGTVRLVIGDVCGHGPDEAALGACLRIGWRSLVLAGVDDRLVLGHLDDLLCTERTAGLFVTVADVTVAPDRRTLTYRLAGHWPPVLSAEGCISLPHDRRGFPLGLGRPGWEDHRLDLPGAWDLIVYTDGLIEGGDGAGTGALLGPEGLCELLDQLGDLQAVVEEVEARNGGPIVDDLALGALTWRPPGQDRW